MTTPDWLVPGAAVVILQPYERAAMRAESTTVARVMKRDVVLANGERFKVDLARTVGGTYGFREYLVHPADARVPEVRTLIRGRRLAAAATAAAETWRRDRTAENARTAAQAFTAYADHQEQTP